MTHHPTRRPEPTRSVRRAALRLAAQEATLSRAGSAGDPFASALAAFARSQRERAEAELARREAEPVDPNQGGLFASDPEPGS